MDIVVWLRSLGLGKYEAAFRENEIDETDLPSLTHETLKELGVTAVGHRLKLLDAIAAFLRDSAARAASAQSTITATVPSLSSEDRAERRQVTVMFSDLVGSTALSLAILTLFNLQPLAAIGRNVEIRRKSSIRLCDCSNNLSTVSVSRSGDFESHGRP